MKATIAGGDVLEGSPQEVAECIKVIYDLNGQQSSEPKEAPIFTDEWAADRITAEQKRRRRKGKKHHGRRKKNAWKVWTEHEKKLAFLYPPRKAAKLLHRTLASVNTLRWKVRHEPAKAQAGSGV